MNLTLNASAKWVIEASREIQNPNTLLEKYSLNRKVDDPTRALVLTFYGILVIIGAVGNALVVISVSKLTLFRFFIEKKPFNCSSVTIFHLNFMQNLRNLMSRYYV